MENLTMVDGGVAAISAVSGLLAYSRGFTRELFALFGWVIAGAAGLYFAPMVEPLIREAPVIGDFLAGSCVLSMIAAVTIIVALGLLIMSVFTPLASSVILDSPLAPVDRALGFVFGIARGLVFVAVIYFVYVNLAGGQAWEPLDASLSKTYLDQMLVQVEAQLPTQVPTWFGERIDALMAPCGVENGAGTESANGQES
ncbi:MAG: CvpA family protein [Pseudomonadota bacterium]